MLEQLQFPPNVLHTVVHVILPGKFIFIYFRFKDNIKIILITFSLDGKYNFQKVYTCLDALLILHKTILIGVTFWNQK